MMPNGDPLDRFSVDPHNPDIFFDILRQGFCITGNYGDILVLCFVEFTCTFMHEGRTTLSLLLVSPL